MKAIVYTSNTGHSAKYAKLIGEKIGIPVFALEEALKKLEKDTTVIYVGWLFANRVKGYKKANKRFKISALCAVGLCDTGTAVEDVRKINAVPTSTPLFTLQGGIDKTKLFGINKYMINTLIKVLSSKVNRSEDEKRMLYLLEHDEDYVSEENASAFLEWYNKR